MNKILLIKCTILEFHSLTNKEVSGILAIPDHKKEQQSSEAENPIIVAFICSWSIYSGILLEHRDLDQQVVFPESATKMYNSNTTS